MLHCGVLPLDLSDPHLSTDQAVLEKIIRNRTRTITLQHHRVITAMSLAVGWTSVQ